MGGDERVMSAWVVYEKPSDYPDLFVARRRVITSFGEDLPTEDLLEAVTLETIREKVFDKMPSAIRIPRDTKDDPVIVETWL